MSNDKNEGKMIKRRGDEPKKTTRTMGKARAALGECPLGDKGQLEGRQ